MPVRRAQKLSMLLWSIPLLLFVGFNVMPKNSATPEAAAIAVAELQSNRPLPPAADTLWVDVRTPGEYEAGHLAEAFNLPLDNFENSFPLFEPNRNRVVALYCRSGNRSGRALSIARGLGYSAAFNAGAYGDLARQRGGR